MRNITGLILSLTGLVIRLQFETICCHFPYQWGLFVACHEGIRQLEVSDGCWPKHFDFHFHRQWNSNFDFFKRVFASVFVVQDDCLPVDQRDFKLDTFDVVQ